MSDRETPLEDARIGARVKARRLELKRSQSWLGERVGVTFQQVQKYEKGTNRISAAQLQIFARALEVPVEHFYQTGFEFPPALHGGLGEQASPGYDAGGVESDIARLTNAVRMANDPKLSKALADFVIAALQNRPLL